MASFDTLAVPFMRLSSEGRGVTVDVPVGSESRSQLQRVSAHESSSSLGSGPHTKAVRGVSIFVNSAFSRKVATLIAIAPAPIADTRKFFRVTVSCGGVSG